MITRYRDGNTESYPGLEGIDVAVEIPELDTLTEDRQTPENAVISQAIRRCWERESSRYDPYRIRSQEAWDHYHQTWNSSEGKDSWQSQSKFPFLLSQVERFTFLLMRVLDVTPNWMELEALVPQHQVFMDIARNYTKFLLEHDTTRFRTKLAEAFRSGLLTGQMRAKVVPEKAGVEQLGQEFTGNTTDPDVLASFRFASDGSKPFIPNEDIPKILIENVPSSNVLLDSTGTRRYQMWQQTIPIGTLIDQADARGFNKDALIRAAHKLTGQDWTRQQFAEIAEKNLGPDGFPLTDAVCTFFEGTLPHQDFGDLLFKDKLCILVGDEVVYGPDETPWWDGEFAIVAAPFIPVPHCVYGKSLLVESIDSFYTENEILNLLIDYCKAAVYGVWEQDVDRIDPDVQRFDGKLYPGEVVPVLGQNGGQPATRRIPIQAIGADFAQFWQIFSSSLENTTGGANQLGGASRARGRMTADEFRSRQADGGSLIQGWFEEIERSFITPLVRLVFLRGLQSTTDAMWKAWVLTQKSSILPPQNQADPALYQNWSQALDECANWKAVDRWKKLGSFFRVKVKIFSALAERQMMLEQTVFLLKQVQAMGAAQYFRMGVLMQNLTRAIGLDPEKVMNLAALDLPLVSEQDQKIGTGFGEFTTGQGDPESSQGDSLDLSNGLMDILNGGVGAPPGGGPGMPPVQPQQMTQQRMNASAFPGGPAQPMAGPPKDVWNGGMGQ